METIQQDEYEILTISEYARHFNLPEPTVRTRCSKGKLKTVQVERNGKTVYAIQVQKNELSKSNEEVTSHNGPQIEEITPSNVIDNGKEWTHYLEVMKSKDDEIQRLHELLKAAEVKAARMEGELKRIDELERIIKTQEQALKTSETAIDALNNERIVITQQLTKYRNESVVKVPDGDSNRPWWKKFFN